MTGTLDPEKIQTVRACDRDFYSAPACAVLHDDGKRLLTTIRTWCQLGGRRFARLSAPHSHTPRAHASIDARVVFATPSRFRSMSRVASFAAALASLLAFAGAASPEGTSPDVSVDVETLPAQLLELSRLSSAEPSTGVHG